MLPVAGLEAEQVDLEGLLVLAAVAIVALLIGVLLVRLAGIILVPLIVGGAAALAVAQYAGWGRVELRREGESYTLTIRVDRPVETLAAWLILSLLVGALLAWR